MASLTNTKIKNTYVSLLKVADNGQLDAALQDITDGAGNTTGIQLNTGGDLTASGTVSFGSLKDSGENITITKFVDAADGISGNDNDTTIPTTAAIKAYVDSNITAQDLDIAGDSGTGAVDLDSQTFTISGTTNEVVTAVSGQTVTIGLPSSITVDVTGNLTGNVSGNVTGNLTGNVTGNVTGDVTGDLTGNVTATSVLVDGVTATTQSIGDNSTKVATTAYVDAAITAEGLDFAGDAGSGTIDLDSEVFTIAGTTNEIETNASGNTLTVGLPSDVTIGNDLTVTTDASVGGTFDVTGTTTLTGDLAVDTDTLFVDVSEDRVGINKAVPTVALDVVGDITSSGSITGTLSATSSLADGVTATTQAANDNSTKVATTAYVDAQVTAEDLDFAGDSGTGAVDLDSQSLTIAGTANEIETSASGQTITIGLPSSVTVGTLTATTLAGTLSTAAQTNITSVGTLSSLSVSGDLTVDTNTLKVDSANNRVGIGTSSPAYPLEIDGGTDNIIARFLSTDTHARIQFTDNTTSAQVSVGAEGNDFVAYTNGQERVRIDSSGNVGIGTSSPSNKLDVNSGATNVVAAFRSTDAGAYVGFADPSTTLDTGSPTLYVGALANDMIFSTSNAERMRITSAGQILFNLTSSIRNNALFQAQSLTGAAATQPTVLLKHQSSTGATYGRTIEFFNSSNVEAGSIESNGTTTRYNTSSDYRLKENVVPMTGALERVDALKPSRFNFISVPELEVDGFIAHELAEVVPEAVSGDKDGIDEEGRPIYQGVDQSKIVPLLVGAIKELKAEIELLKSQING